MNVQAGLCLCFSHASNSHVEANTAKICKTQKLNHAGPRAQSITCLTADPGVASLIQTRFHTFLETVHEIISTVILLLSLIHSRRVVVSYKRKYVHEVLVNRLVKLVQEKSVASKKCQHKSVIIFLFISLNMCFGYSKEPSH